MSKRHNSASRLILALLALVAQLTSAQVLPQMEAVAALADATTICHTDGQSHQTPSPSHHPSDCLICPLCVSLSAPAFATPEHPTLPAPRVIVAARTFILPLTTAPPTTVIFAARPRGPPTILT